MCTRTVKHLIAWAYSRRNKDRTLPLKLKILENSQQSKSLNVLHCEVSDKLPYLPEPGSGWKILPISIGLSCKAVINSSLVGPDKQRTCSAHFIIPFLYCKIPCRVSCKYYMLYIICSNFRATFLQYFFRWRADCGFWHGYRQHLRLRQDDWK